LRQYIINQPGKIQNHNIFRYNRIVIWFYDSKAFKTGSSSFDLAIGLMNRLPAENLNLHFIPYRLVKWLTIMVFLLKKDYWSTGWFMDIILTLQQI
jgi:hypothetical protein